MSDTEQTRVSWTSKFGFLMAAAGSAVGLGNLWRFPFITAQGGGGAFLLMYLILVASVGFSLVVLEMGLGHKMHLNPVGAMRRINSRFGFIGSIGILAVTVIFAFYAVIGGWIIHYFVLFCTRPLIHDQETYFSQFIQNPYAPVIYTFFFIALSAFIVSKGIANGIEKYSKIMMPVLFILLLVLMARSMTLPNAFDGIGFFLYPDVSKITGQTFLTALGQVFFSLSVGMGIFITYGSYMAETESPVKAGMIVVFLDTLISVCAGVMIFPAVFSFHVPLNSGPTLIFITLPKIFAAMPFGNIVGILFFMLLLLAALTSSISMIEVAVAYLNDHHKLPRRKAVLAYSLFCFTASVPLSLSFGIWKDVTLFSKNLFDCADFLASNVLLPLGGFLMCLAVGWFYGIKHLDLFQSRFGNAAFDFMIKFVAPIAVFMVFLSAVGLI